MKDFDDLWRIAKSKNKIDSQLLREIFLSRSIPLKLSTEWVDEDLQNLWTNHITRYKDLPINLIDTIKEINAWFKNAMKELNKN